MERPPQPAAAVRLPAGASRRLRASVRRFRPGRAASLPSAHGSSARAWKNETVYLVARIAGTSSILPVSPVRQVGNVGQQLTNPLVVEVVDQSGNPVSGVPVAFQVSQWPSGAQGYGVFPPSDTTQMGTGTASTQFVLGDTPGNYQVTASCACTPASVTFSARTGGVLTLADPVPNLQDATGAVISVPATLGRAFASGRVVQGVAADGVAERESSSNDRSKRRWSSSGRKHGVSIRNYAGRLWVRRSGAPVR